MLKVAGTLIFLLLLWPQMVLGLTYTVNPNLLEVSIKPGREMSPQVHVKNLDLTKEKSYQIRKIFLHQSEKGKYEVISDKTKESSQSAFSWVNLNEDIITVPPQGEKAFTINLKAPRSVSGVYTTGLLISEVDTNVQNKKQTGESLGFSVTVQFLVPLLITIEGRSQTTRLQAKDANLEYFAGDRPEQSKTSAYLYLENIGNSAPDIEATLTVYKKLSPNSKIKISTIKNQFRTMLPGSTYKIDFDLDSGLPAGEYLLSYLITEKKRRVSVYEKEVEFEGTPGIVDNFKLKAFYVDIPRINLKSFPGGSAKATLNVQNVSDQKIIIESALKSSNINEAYRAGDWLKAYPNPAQLMGLRNINMRLTGRIPRDIDKPYYYTYFELTAKYENGEKAGDITIPVVINNEKAQPVFQASINDTNITARENNLYEISCQLQNTGNGHFDLAYEAHIDNRLGKSQTSTEMSCGKNMLYPQEKATLGGVLDISGLETGDYQLVITGNCGPDCTQEKKLPLRISGDTEKNIEFLDQS